jgi:serine/threonine protein kinase/Tfp pilus assembly protein PilF
MGEVYRAKDSRLDREVAVKVLREALAGNRDALKRFEHEAKAVAALSHPNILTIYDVGTHEDLSFAVMELLEGESLRARINRSPLPWKEAVEIGIAVADAVAAAHSKGIIHRDLKPENIFLTSDDRVKILDFGLARLRPVMSQQELTQAPTKSVETELGALIGTAPYMSPEQIHGERVDARSDIFSLGCVIFEMLTGKRPFSGKTIAETLIAILQDEPPALYELGKDFPPELERLIRQCLEKKPDRRFHSAHDLALALKAVLGGGAVPTSSLKTQTRLIALQRPAFWFKATAALLTTLALIFAWRVGKRLEWRQEPQASAAKIKIQALAVLPLENLSGDASQDYFVDGMTDALTNVLAQIGSIRVTSTHSVMQYKEMKKPLSEIAKELDVNALVKGSVMRSGDQVKIQAQLIEEPGERQLWQQSYERSYSDVVKLQNEVSLAVAHEVRINLTSHEQGRLARNRSINPQAYEAYLKGMAAEGGGESNEYLQQAVKLDPHFAPAFSAMAGNYFFLGLFGDLPPEEAFKKVKENSSNAMELDENFADPHGWLALALLHYDWNFPEAEKEFKHALELNPNSADIHHVYAHYLIAMNRREDSVAESERALEINPFDASLIGCLAWHNLFARQYDQARDQALKALRLSPEDWWSHVNLGLAYEQKTMLPEATAEFQKSTTLWPGNALSLASLGHAFASSGKKQKAEEALSMLLGQRKRGFVPAYDIAIVYAGLNNKDQAFEWLQKANEERSAFLVFVRWDPRLDNLHSDPRFQDLLRKIGLPP